MSYVVIATWIAKEGEEAEVERVLSILAPLCREEPGCREFSVLHAEDEPRTYVLYEVYVDEAALVDHRESAHYQRLVQGDAAARLEQRQAKFYQRLA